ncbi:MAG: hypothetical protein IIA02_11290 [Proteobacteria bacterium]|uniref:hypothetical protein n=1 Tax=Aquabacterium sp. TaxID=1872578 RepID=UPI0035C6E19B|nr:hypothetical protein [Pseudomonadota bacterium]
MSPWHRCLSALLGAAALLLTAGCAQIAPPYTYDVTRPTRPTAPRPASDMVIVLDSRMEWTSRPFAPDQAEYPPFLEYTRFGEALQTELSSRWPGVTFTVAHSTAPEPDLKPFAGRGHVVIMSLKSLVHSSRSGISGRTWHLTVLQGEAPEQRLYSALMQAKFKSDFTSCYAKQATVSDNKPQCRQAIVEHVASLLKQAEVLR